MRKKVFNMEELIQQIKLSLDVLVNEYNIEEVKISIDENENGEKTTILEVKFQRKELKNGI